MAGSRAGYSAKAGGVSSDMSLLDTGSSSVRGWVVKTGMILKCRPRMSGERERRKQKTRAGGRLAKTHHYFSWISIHARDFATAASSRREGVRRSRARQRGGGHNRRRDGGPLLCCGTRGDRCLNADIWLSSSLTRSAKEPLEHGKSRSDMRPVNGFAVLAYSVHCRRASGGRCL